MAPYAVSHLHLDRNIGHPLLLMKGIELAHEPPWPVRHLQRESQCFVLRVGSAMIKGVRMAERMGWLYGGTSVILMAFALQTLINK